MAGGRNGAVVGDDVTGAVLVGGPGGEIGAVVEADGPRPGETVPDDSAVAQPATLIRTRKAAPARHTGHVYPNGLS